MEPNHLENSQHNKRTMFVILLVIPAPRLRGGKLRESNPLNKMDTRLRGYDISKSWYDISKKRRYLNDNC